MNEFLKQNWFKILSMLVIVIIIGVIFYWYSWMPSKIRKECNSWALYKATGGEIENLGKDSKYNQDAYNDYYKRCLREKGL